MVSAVSVMLWLEAVPRIVSLRAAPSGTPVRVGGTLSLTGFLAQTAIIHKIAAEIMVEESNGRNGFLGRPVEYVLLDDIKLPKLARSPREKRPESVKRRKVMNLTTMQTWSEFVDHDDELLYVRIRSRGKKLTHIVTIDGEVKASPVPLQPAS